MGAAAAHDQLARSLVECRGCNNAVWCGGWGGCRYSYQPGGIALEPNCSTSSLNCFPIALTSPLHPSTCHLPPLCRRALLEADVSLPVVRRFVKKVEEAALGERVIKGVAPDQKLVKVRWGQGGPQVLGNWVPCGTASSRGAGRVLDGGGQVEL